MVSKSQNKEAEASKATTGSMAQGDEPKTGSVEVEKSTQSKPSKRMRFSSTSEKDSSTATFVEEPKSGRGISTMSRVVKRKIEKVKPVVEFNKDGKPHGKDAVEMQSYIGVLARTRVPLVDKKWKQLPKDVKEQIWEAVQMSYVIGDSYKNLVLSSAAKKWKDFKYNVTKQYILPFAHDKEKLKEIPLLYKFIEKSQWDAFIASRLTPDFEAKHAEQKERREKLEYNHRLSRKGYVGLTDQLVETMPEGQEIDRAVLWKKAREDKIGNIPDPKATEKAKLIVSLTNSVLNLKNRVFYFGIDVVYIYISDVIK